MTSKTMTVTNETGLHMRPAGALAAAAGKQACDVKIRHKGGEVNAKSVMHIMAACIKKGDEIELICDGEGEAEALAALASLVEAGID